MVKLGTIVTVCIALTLVGCTGSADDEANFCELYRDYVATAEELRAAPQSAALGEELAALIDEGRDVVPDVIATDWAEAVEQYDDFAAARREAGQDPATPDEEVFELFVAPDVAASESAIHDWVDANCPAETTL